MQSQLNSEHEIRKSKQILNSNNEIRNKAKAYLYRSRVWFCPRFLTSNLDLPDLFRASIFGFRICIIPTLIFFLCGCGKEKAKKAEEIVPVRSRKVVEQVLKRTLDYASSIRAENDAFVYPKVTGKIIEKIKDDGDVVAKGDVLAYVDRDEVGFKFEKAPVQAPLAGMVGMVTVDKGDSVSPQTAIAQIVSIDNVRVSLDVPEKHLPDVALGQAAEITVDAFPGQTFTGKVSKISPIVELATRTAPVEIFIPNPGQKLKPGMFARVKLVLEEREHVRLVPREAVLGRNPQATLFVVEGKTVRLRPVTTGAGEGGLIEITAGVSNNEEVVIMGQQRLRDGMTVLAERDNDGAERAPEP